MAPECPPHPRGDASGGRGLDGGGGRPQPRGGPRQAPRPRHGPSLAHPDGPLAIDGAEVPPRPETAQGRRPGPQQVRAKRARWTGEWREAKGVRLYLLAADRMIQVLSWHQVQTDEEAAAALRQVKAAGLIPEQEVRLCMMADGARWIWQQAQALCPLRGRDFG